MLSISKPKKGGAGGGYYFKYYSDHSDERGRWFGSGAKVLGLGEIVQKKQLNHLLEGFSPEGNSLLVQNAGGANRQGFWDLTLSAPKSVSVLYMAAPDWVRKEIEDSMRAAMKTTLNYVEEAAGLSRRGKGGCSLDRAALAFATFFHTSSRAEDPQLHFHCLLLNVGVRSDGTTGSLHTLQVFREKMNGGALFQVQLAHELGQRLGVQIQDEKVGFHIKGIPKELCDDCSKRRKDIEAELKIRGANDAVSAKEAALKTRGKKEYTTREHLDKWWARIAASRNWGPENVERLVKATRQAETQKERTEHAFRRAFGPALDKIFPQDQTWSRALRVAAKTGLEHGVDARTVLAALRNAPLPKHCRFHRLEWRPLFPKAPPWNPARKLRLPVVALTNRPTRWGKILWKHPIWTAARAGREIRIQERLLFPRAPNWSPLHGLALPALHVAKKSNSSIPRGLPREQVQSLGR